MTVLLVLVVVLSIALLMALLRLQHRRDLRRAEWKDWHVLLTPRGQQTYEEMRYRMTDELTLVDIALRHAAEMESFGSTEEAKQFLDVGTKLIETHAPNMRRLLAGMAVFSRMVSAMAPVKPLRPRDFQLRQLVRLAQVNRLLHHFIVTGAERFRFKVYILRAAFGVAARFFVRRSREIHRNDKEAQTAWQALDSLRHDVHTLTDESLEMFRLLVLSLSR